MQIIIARESAIIYFVFEFNVLVQVFLRILLHYMIVPGKIETTDGSVPG